MDSELKENLTSQEAWTRGLFMVMFFILLELAKAVAGMVVVLQFLFTIFTSQTNENLLRFGGSLTRYIYQTWSYLTYNSETRPFPFSAWPDGLESSSDEPEEPGDSDDSVQRLPGKD